jgi:hypothetical protein
MLCWNFVWDTRYSDWVIRGFPLSYQANIESQHSFEILIDAFIHAEQGTLQPQLITAEKIEVS